MESESEPCRRTGDHDNHDVVTDGIDDDHDNGHDNEDNESDWADKAWQWSSE